MWWLPECEHDIGAVVKLEIIKSVLWVKKQVIKIPSPIFFFLSQRSVSSECADGFIFMEIEKIILKPQFLQTLPTSDKTESNIWKHIYIQTSDLPRF